MTDKTYSPIKITELKPGDEVLFHRPYVTRTVTKAGWHYSTNFDTDYFLVNFAGGMEYISDDGQDAVYAYRAPVDRLEWLKTHQELDESGLGSPYRGSI